MDYKIGIRKYLPVLLVISLIASSMETDIAIPSFPKIADYFGISGFMVKMTIAINYLGYSISSIIYGPLSESWGRKKVMILGNSIMCIGSLGCSLSPNIYWLLCFRFIQGFGASTSAIIVFAIIADVYVGRQSTKIISRMSAFLYILVAGTPLIGGLINEFFGWRVNYWTIFIISTISTLLLYIALPETKDMKDNFSIKETLQNYKNIFFNKRFILLGVSLSIFYSVYVSFISCASFLYTETFNKTNIIYTSHQTAIILVFSIISMFTINIVNFLGEKKALLHALTLSLFSMLFMYVIAIKNNGQILFIEYLVTFSMIIFCAGEAILYPMLFTKALDIIPNQKGIISSSLSAIRSILSSFFVWIMSLFYNGSLLNIAVVLLLQTIILSIFIILILRSFILSDINLSQ
ncbi:MAG: multidrug effflux MFS transporter [Rickettsia sp.]|nr:multidrug effflux MFS transporter [Rickettsia sp.]